MSERRRGDRTPAPMKVTHILDDQHTCECAVEDLSLEGMRVRRLDEGEWGNPRHVWLRFQLPDGGEPIQALGELRHDGGPEPVRGFRFKYIFPRARRRYEAFVHAHLTQAA